MNRFSTVGVGLMSCVLVAGAYGQVTSGNIAGVVKDSTGAVLPDVPVSIKSEATGVTVTVKTNAQGEYLVQNLLPASYDITIAAQGFAPSLLKGVAVALNSTATADVTVQTGATTTEVEVTAASVVLDTTTQNLTQTFEPEQLATLPVTATGEGVLNASLLSPGVGSTGGIGIGVGPSIAGQRPRNNNFTIEGIDNNDKSVTGPLVYVPNDAVGEFTLITTQFSPEFGHSSGGQFNTNIQSGTNHFHGKVYEYFRNRNLDAASGVAGGKVPNPDYDYNRYGAQLGGPVLRNKLFFFANYERETIRNNDAYYLCTPTAAGLSTIAGLANTPGYSTNNIQQYEKYIPAADVYGGAQVTAANDLACGATTLALTSGPSDANGNQTGTAQATIPLGNYLASAPESTIFDTLVTSADYTISSTDSLRARYIYNTESATDTAVTTSPGLPTFLTQLPYRYHLFALSEFHNFTPNLVNEVRIGFNRYYNNTPSGNFEYPGLDQFPNLTFYDQGFINVGPDPNAPQFTIQNLYQITDNISYTKGKHTIKVGFDGRKYISPQGFTQRARGDYEWSYLSDFLHDYAPDEYGGLGERSTGSHTYYGDQTALYGYGNDTWRISDKVTLNYGLRYEFTSVPVGERSQALNAVASVPGLIDFHAPQPTYTALAPRVGIAYAPDSKTSIRLGYGVAYDVLFDNLGTLSFPPQYSTTKDVGQGNAPGYSTPNFLANGGLPAGNGSGVAVLDHADAVANTSAYLPDQILPYSENYTLTIQRELSKGLTGEIGYIGDRGVHLPVQDRINVQPKTNLTNYLPTYANGVALNGRGSNATTLNAINALSNYKAPYLAAGFDQPLTSYQPYGGSNYNGLISALQGRLRNGLQIDLAYTFSKAMDNSTAEVFATTLTPRRPQNPEDLDAEYSRSALDHTHRATLELDYNFQPFKPNQNWLLKNIVGNWRVVPIYTYESPEYATVLSGGNGLLTGDGAYVGRPIINPNGVKGTSSTVSAITNAAGQTVGYTANNPTAYYIQAGSGALPDAGRNTLPGRPTDNLSAAAYKNLTFRERYTFEFGAQAFNVLNHAQYIPGAVDDVGAYSYTGLSYTTVGSSLFNQPQLNFQNNARVLQLTAKFDF